MMTKAAIRAARKSQAAQHAGLILLRERNKQLERVFNSAMEALRTQSELLCAVEEENDKLRTLLGAPKSDKLKDEALKECATFFQERGYSLRSKVFKKLAAALGGMNA